MRVLCTGGAGYVGSACLRHLLRHGLEAFAYDDLSEGRAAAVPDADRRLVVGSILDRPLLERTLRDRAIDAVMHFAAVASVPESIARPAEYWEINVVGTKNVLDAMRAAGVASVVFSSTAATYAFSDRMPLEEDDLQAPVTPYGTTKLACERMLDEYRTAYGIAFTAMRYFNASGADEDGEFGEDRRAETHLIPLVLYAAVGRREKVMVFGDDWPTRDGTCVRDYVHVDDIAQAHRLALAAHRPGVGRFYNIGSSSGATVREIVTACERAAGRPIRTETAPRRPGDPAVLIASSDRLRRELGWEPRLPSVDDIVGTAYRWHSRYPGGYADKR